MKSIKLERHRELVFFLNVSDTATVTINSVASRKEEVELARLVEHRFNSYDANQERIKELERLADNLLWKCVESDSDIAESDAWHKLERKLKHDL